MPAVSRLYSASAVLTCLLIQPLIAANPQESKVGAQSSLEFSAEDLPSYHQVRSVVRDLLRRQARDSSWEQSIVHVLQIIDLAQEITGDPRFSDSPHLQELRGSLYARLRRVKRDTEKMARRQQRKPQTITIRREVLAQLNRAVVNGNRGNGNRGNNGVANSPNASGFAPQLISLIQRTISPPSWDVNGGKSTIQYWRPGMALVVRAPGAIHREVGPILGKLRQP